MAKRSGVNQIMPDLEAHMQQGFNRLIRTTMRRLATKKRSPVYTGFFASSWMADRKRIQPTDKVRDFKPWSDLKKEKGKKSKIDARFYPPDKPFNFRRRVYIGNKVEYAVWALEDGRIQRFVQGPEMARLVKESFKERRPLISVAGRGGVGTFGSFAGKTYIDYSDL